MIAPSERIVVDALFEQPGRLTLEHRTPERTYRLATIEVGDEPATPALAEEFAVLRENPEWSQERERLAPYVDAAPDKTLAFVAEMDMGVPEGPVVYACPMHPEVTGEESDRCPKCGMKLLAVRRADELRLPDAPEVVSDTPDRCPKCGMKLHRRPASSGEGAHTSTGTRSTRTTQHGARGPRSSRRRTTIDHGHHDSRHMPAGSSGRTTWSRSTG